MFDRVHDAKERRASFDWFSLPVEIHGDVLPRTLLADGFMLDDMRVPLLGPQGIFKPKVLEEARRFRSRQPQELLDAAHIVPDAEPE